MLRIRLSRDTIYAMLIADYVDAHFYRYIYIDTVKDCIHSPGYIIADRYPLIDVARRDYSHSERVKIRW